MLDKVNILMGTATTFDLSHGNALPIVARPFGMAHWSLQTSADTGWFFHADNPKLQGFRLTHQPSPWIKDYGAVVLMPQTGPLVIPAKQRGSCYRRCESVLRPDYLKLRLLRYRVDLEMTPTERGALFVLRFPGDAANRLILEPVKGESSATILQGDRRIVGFTRGNSGGAPGNFACYYAIAFNQPIAGAGTIVDEKPTAGLQAMGDRAGAYVEFPDGAITVEARMATSFVSVEQAQLNLERELAGRSRDALRREAEKSWLEVFSRIAIETGEDEWRRTFYGCLYRCFLFPRLFHEFDRGGAMVHYSPCDGRVHPGPFYTDTGFWDTYRTLFPLLNLLDRPRSAEMMEGFVNCYREGGWLPQWSSPGYRGAMIGTHSEAVLAHAILSGIKGFDWETAYAAMKRDCMDVPDRNGVGRAGLEDYLDLGYVPADHPGAPASASRTLDYAYDDHCAAMVADVLGHKADAKRLRRRAQNYRNVYDPSVGFVRGRNRDGSWVPFNPFDWGGPYVEGGAWQSTWAVQHDPQGLIALMGGRKKFLAKLDEFMTLPPHFNTGTYVQEIHEMTEMAMVDFGQYAHSNQPVHNVLYFFTLAGAPEKNRHWVRRVLTELYNSGDRGFCGDEDNGEMSAWYVFSSLGLFPFCPGSGKLVIGGLLFDRAVIRPAGAEELVIERLSRGKSRKTETVPAFNGAAIPTFEIGVREVAEGGILRVPAL